MSETKMPAAEAEAELMSYELAFHVLPTVAEGEVATVFQSLKDIITKHGGSLTVEEAPERFDLAYEIVKHLEGRNRKFTSAYFGWVRFTISPSELDAINEEIDGVKELLRHILVKLTKVAEENPFYFHEALAEQQVETIEVNAENAEVEGKNEEAEEASTKEETAEKTEDSTEDGEESKDEV